jgi:antitoxin component YwqK of YwqJK toxin-antitoxin module
MWVNPLLFTTIAFCCYSVVAGAQQTPEHFTADELPVALQTTASPRLFQVFPYTVPESGNWIEKRSNGLLFTVSTKKGKLHGVWQSWYTDGKRCDSGKLVNNIPDGEWKHWSQEGELLAVRHYSADHFRRVTDEMRNFHPKRNFYFLGTLYQRKPEVALFYLDALYSFPQGAKMPVVKSIKELAERNCTFSNYRPVFLQCLHEGLFMNFFSGGLVQDSGHFKDGLRTGKWIHRDTAAAGWYQGAYYHGTRVKEWKHYDEDGRLTELLHYRNGRLIWRKKIKRG